MLALPVPPTSTRARSWACGEVEDLPEELLQDPTWERSGHRWRGRDGCRVPMPWSGTAPPFGFGPAGCVPWLPQPAEWGSVAVEAQAGEPGSMLELYRAALRIRRTQPGLAGEELPVAARVPRACSYSSAARASSAR